MRTRLKETSKFLNFSLFVIIKPCNFLGTIKIILMTIIAFNYLPMPETAIAQTLDEAVTEQLKIGPLLGLPCEKLLFNRSVADLLEGGALREDICDRSAPIGNAFPSQSTGGGAGTPTTLPSIVQKKLDEEKEDKSVDATNESGERFGFFISGGYETLDRDVTTFEDSYSSDILRLTIGSDANISKRLTVGLAFDTSNQNGDFGNGGGFDVESYGLVGFGLYRPTNNSFIQIYGSYTLKSNERKRFATFTETEKSSGEITLSISGRPDADFDVDQYSAGGQIGYDYQHSGLTIGPRAGLDWIYTDFDTYSEKSDSGLALTFHNDEVTSLQSHIGLLATFTTSTSFGVVTMQPSLFWKHEFEQGQRDVEVSFVEDLEAKRFTYQTEKPDRDFFELNAGVSVVLPNGIQGFVNFRTLLGHSYFDSYAGTVGLRVEL